MIEIANGVFINSDNEDNIRNLGHDIASARIGMAVASHRSIGSIAIAFKCYHWLKIDRYEDIKQYCDSESFERTRDLLRRYARLLVDELPNQHNVGSAQRALAPCSDPPLAEE